jgi:uncharacterized protein YkwD
MADASGMRRTLAILLVLAAGLAALLSADFELASAEPQSHAGALSSRHLRTHAKSRKHHRHRHKHHRRHRKHHRHHARKHRRAGALRSSATRASFDCTNTNLIPTSEDLDAIRSATICLVNRERSLHGERPLQVNGRLMRAAQGHSENMAAEDYFSHYGPSGDTPTSRMRAAGYIYSSNVGYEIGENIAWGTLGLSTPKAIVEAWMRSPGHRENILDAHYRDTGMGVVASLPRSFGNGQPGAIYTQDFGVLIGG